MNMVTEWQINNLSERLRKTENELLRIRQLRPLVDIGDGWSECISFEQMSEFAALWMEQEGIHTKEDLEDVLK